MYPELCPASCRQKLCSVAKSVAGFSFAGHGAGLCEAPIQKREAVMDFSAGAAKCGRGASPTALEGGLQVAAKNLPVILRHPSCETT